MSRDIERLQGLIWLSFYLLSGSILLGN